MILCFGEILLRYSPLQNGESFHLHAMPVHVGGAELNVACALAKWELPVAYCTAMPDNFLSVSIRQYISHCNIDTSAIRFSGERMGVYYLLQGHDVKDAGIEFDRAGSSFAHLKPGDIDWVSLLKNTDWFHFSAIAASLTENTAAALLEALQVASSMGIRISVDLNYRHKLWKYGKKPPEVMRELLPYCNLVMGNIWSAHSLLGIEVDEHIHDIGTKEGYLAHARLTSQRIQQQFPQCAGVANTFRFDNDDSDIHYYTTLFQDGELYTSPEFNCKTVVDKVGSGDCFMAGLIYGYKRKLKSQSILNFATAAAFGKLQEAGDTTAQSINDVQRLLNKYV